MKRRVVVGFALLCIALSFQGGNAAPCNVQYSLFITESWTYTCPMGPNDGTTVSFTKSQQYHLIWPGPAYPGKNPVEVYPSATGLTNPYISGGDQYCPNCFPDFLGEINLDRYWAKQVRDVVDIMGCVKGDIRNSYVNPQSPVCSCPAVGQPPCVPSCSSSCTWNEVYCQWENCTTSPIIIDLDNDGYNLTNAANGVRFDLAGTGERKQWSWTARNSDEAFLALDRNDDGVINSGKELFGDVTDQPASGQPNGFIALAVFDSNGDRWIDDKDPVYSRLRLWVDSNHDGVSQASELHSLDWGGVEGIDLDYKLSKRSDQHGNNFRYRAKVPGKNLDRWAWDVFLLPGN